MWSAAWRVSLALGVAPGVVSDVPRRELPELGLSVALDGLTGFGPVQLGDASAGGAPLARWEGTLEASEVAIELWALDREEYGLDSPEDVLELVEQDRSERAPEGSRAFRFQETFAQAGTFGALPYAWLGIHEEPAAGSPPRCLVALGGLLPDHGYTIEVACEPCLDERGREALLESLRGGVSYEGATLDPRWTDEEALARWLRGAPERVLDQDELGIIRTDHYIILTNMRATGGTARKFGKKMEECYDTVRDAFPFQEVEGRRLMPVFLFKTPDQYHRFYAKVFDATVEEGRRTGGVASQDFYATAYEAPNDPVHLHEATHQIFRNRLRLHGGGSWFQEGVAEYLESRANERKLFRNAVKSEKHVPLRTFLGLKSLLFSTEVGVGGGNAAGDNYRQAACVIEFARESKWGRERFQDFVHAVGRVPRGDLVEIEAALLGVYGVGIEEFEAEFLEYWRKR